jgi:formylglycine-generating enzyme required for sulfatase activity
MRCAVALLLASVGTPLVGPSSASAGKRVALVIGINVYDNLPALQKAVNDQKAVAAALAGLDFDVVAGENLTRREMNAKLAELDAKIAPGDTVFFYFAGHGVALGAENFLLPRDLPKPRDGEENLVRDEGHAVDAIVRRVQSRGAAVSFFVLDACRDNPLAASGVRSIGGTRGLTRVDAPNGVFVLYSAGLGQSALDRLGEDDPDPNSVFTRKLVPLLKTPGLTQVSLAKQVQREVDELAASIRHPQQPAYYDQIIGEIELSPTAVAKTSPASAPTEELETQVAVAAPTIPPIAPPKPVEPVVGMFPKAVTPSPQKPGDTFKDCEICPEMVVVPPGEFMMGSSSDQEGTQENESSQHKVAIRAPFAVGKFEVTKEQFDAFVNDAGYYSQSKCFTFEGGKLANRLDRSYQNPGYEQAPNEPAVCLSWEDARAYAAWLSRKTGQQYRLLSEAEWEYAALAGNGFEHSRLSEANLCDDGNISDQAGQKEFPQEWPVAECSDGYARTAPVGRFTGNRLGLHDMRGNAWEWINDCWHDTYDGAPSDGSSWTWGGDCSSRVLRGGSWISLIEYLRVTSRFGMSSDHRDASFGVRVARTL